MMNSAHHLFDASAFKSSVNQQPHLQSCWVFVSNLPRDVNEGWVRMLFATIGSIDSVTLTTNETSASAYVLFRTAEQAKAALHFNGFTATGINLQVRHPTPFEAATLINANDPMLYVRSNSLPSLSLPRLRASNPMNEQATAHKNLYVLNLPLDASTDELTALFASYGTVVHCVILAMLDTQARRRGFIDMSNPKEAKEAIEGLNGFVWHGYPIEVSYAIVQRSGGPFDQVAGRNIIKRNVPRNRFNTGPRRIPSDSSLDASLFAGLTQQFNRQLQLGQSGPEPHQPSFGPLDALSPDDNGGSIIDPLTIFISGLDPVAIIDDDDFRHALEPYGAITAATLCRDDNGTSRGFGIVTFASAQSATKACDAIDGKMVNGRRLAASKYAYQAPLTALSSANGLLQDNSSVLAQSRRYTTPTPSPFTSAQLYTGGGTHQGGAGGFLTQPTAASMRPLLSNAATASSLQWPSNSVAPYFSKPAPYTDMLPNSLNWTTGLPPTSTTEVFSSSKIKQEEPPLFSKASSGNRAVEIKPDPQDAIRRVQAEQLSKKLGDAFVPSVTSSTKDVGTLSGEGSGKDHQRTTSMTNLTNSTPVDAGDTTQTPSMLHLGTAQGLSWHGKAFPSSNSLGLDGLSPQSILSTPSTISTANIQTPATHGAHDSAQVWTNSKSEGTDNFGSQQQNQVSRRGWNETKPSMEALKHIGQTGSALLSLQSDVVEKQSRNNMPLLNPVGHEKSSPMRATAGKQRNNVL